MASVMISCPKCGASNIGERQTCKQCSTALHGDVSQQLYFDKQDQVEKIRQSLIPGEVIEGVFDMKGGGTGFLGITTKRIIVYDKTFLRKMKALVSIPYSRVHSVAAEDERGLLTGGGFFSSSKLVITTSHGEMEFEFRGADKAHLAHNLMIQHMV